MKIYTVSAVLLPVLFPVALLCAQAPPIQQPAPAVPQPDFAMSRSCPLHVDEAYLTTDTAGMTPGNAGGRRVLHVSFVDASGKPIKSYEVHGRIALRPDPTLQPGPRTGTVVRKWEGDLQPDTPKKEQWSFPAGRFSMSLRSIWFDKVTFGDGTEWNKSVNDNCSFGATGHIMQAMHPADQ